MHITLVFESLDYLLIHAALHNQVVDDDRMILPLTMQTLVRLLVLLQAPRQPEPDGVMAAALQIQTVAAARGVRKQDVDFSVVPILLIFRLGINPDAQVIFCQSLNQPVPVVLEVIEHKGVLPVQLLDQLQESVDFAVVDFDRRFVLVVDRPVAKLQELSCQNSRTAGGYRVLVHLQKQLRLKLGIKVVHYQYDLFAVDNVPAGRYLEYPDRLLPVSTAFTDLASPELHRVVCASGDKFVGDAAEKLWLHNEFGADICDMESAAILLTCDRNRVPCLIIKAVADSLSGGAAEYWREKNQTAKSCLDYAVEVIDGL